MITEAQKRASKKWENKYENIRVRVEKGKKKQIEEFAKNKGISVNELFNKLIDSSMMNNSINKK